MRYWGTKDPSYISTVCIVQGRNDGGKEGTIPRAPNQCGVR